WYGSVSYPPTIAPNPATRLHHASDIRSPAYRRSDLPDTSDDSGREWYSRVHSVQEYHAIARQCGASRTDHSECGDATPRDDRQQAHLSAAVVRATRTAHQSIRVGASGCLLTVLPDAAKLHIPSHRFQVAGQNLARTFSASLADAPCRSLRYA